MSATAHISTLTALNRRIVLISQRESIRATLARITLGGHKIDFEDPVIKSCQRWIVEFRETIGPIDGGETYQDMLSALLRAMDTAKREFHSWLRVKFEDDDFRLFVSIHAVMDVGSKSKSGTYMRGTRDVWQIAFERLLAYRDGDYERCYIEPDMDSLNLIKKFEKFGFELETNTIFVPGLQIRFKTPMYPSREGPLVVRNFDDERCWETNSSTPRLAELSAQFLTSLPVMDISISGKSIS